MAAPHSQETSARAPARSLHDSLVRLRLTHREARLKLVIAALRHQSGELDRHGSPTPKPLLAALAGFEQELTDVRTALRGELALPDDERRADSPPA